MSPAEIKKKCFVSTRFIQAFRELSNQHPDYDFTKALAEAFEAIIKIAETNNAADIARSQSYADYFAEETGSGLTEENPFCVIQFSDSLDITFIFVLPGECKEKGDLSLLIRGCSEASVVCAIDFFDASHNQGLYRARR